ncbi:hypothetical protein [Acidovorax sp. A1169]|uniref:hypothetical protein n=1 Tax=Acidovorax sp. A1169 TaxID=3059524 RepID=UPI002737B314|nr:hypothetical protein [Acidovorax sp. A1169]MDP4076216.1 hypothetical protein [Acidovorax sp. A1169]
MQNDESGAVGELVAQMRNEEVGVPLVRDVALAYARQVAAIAHKLSPDELASMVELGVVIDRRSSRLVPIMGSIGDEGWISDNLGRPQTSLGGGRPL